MQLIFDAENTAIGIESKMTSVDHTSVCEKFEDAVITDARVELIDETKITPVTGNSGNENGETVKTQEDLIDEASSDNDDVKADSEKKVYVSSNDSVDAVISELQAVVDDIENVTVDEVDKVKKPDAEMIEDSQSVTDTKKCNDEVIDETVKSTGDEVDKVTKPGAEMIEESQPVTDTKKSNDEVIDETVKNTVDEVDEVTKPDAEMIEESQPVTDTKKSNDEVIDETVKNTVDEVGNVTKSDAEMMEESQPVTDTKKSSNGVIDETVKNTVDEVDKVTKPDAEMIEESQFVTETEKSNDEMIDETVKNTENGNAGVMKKEIPKKKEPDAAIETDKEIKQTSNENTNLSAVEVASADIELSAETVSINSIAEKTSEKVHSEEESSFNYLLKLEKRSTADESDKIITNAKEYLQGAGDIKKTDAKELIDDNNVDIEMAVQTMEQQSNQENIIKPESSAVNLEESIPEIVMEAPIENSQVDSINKIEVDIINENDSVSKEVDDDIVKKYTSCDEELVKSAEELEKEDFSMSVDELIDEKESEKEDFLMSVDELIEKKKETTIELIPECAKNKNSAEVAACQPAETDLIEPSIKHAEVELEKTDESELCEPTLTTFAKTDSDNLSEDVIMRSGSESSETVSDTKRDSDTLSEKVSSGVTLGETKLLDKFVAEDVCSSDLSVNVTSSSQIYSSSSTSDNDFSISDVTKTPSNDDIVIPDTTKSLSNEDIEVTEETKSMANNNVEVTEVTKSSEDIAVTETIKSSSNDDIEEDEVIGNLTANEISESTEVTKPDKDIAVMEVVNAFNNDAAEVTEIAESTANNAIKVTETKVTTSSTNAVILDSEVAKSEDIIAVTGAKRTRTSSNETEVLEEKYKPKYPAPESEPKPEAKKDAFKLNNTLDILSDDEEEALKNSKKTDEKVPEKDSEEKQTINIDDDDDIMLIDDDTNIKEDDKVESAQEPPKEGTPVPIETVDLDPKEPEIVKKSDTDNEPSTSAAVPDAEKAEASSEKLKKVEPEPKQKRKPLVPENFFKTYKKNLTDMTRDDLEEFCILKIVESIIDRSSLNETKTKLKFATHTVEELKKKTLSLTKQNRDLQLVLKSVQEEQKKNSNTITPLKITRSVGMQVLMSDSKMRRKMAIPPPSATNSNNTPKSGKKVGKPRPHKPPVQQIPVPRLVPATNIKSPISQAQPANNSIKSPMTNGVKILQVPKAEKRTHSRMQSQSVTVDLTDDEPPAKVLNKSPAPPVRLVPSQNLLARPNSFPQGTSPRKVFIPISGTQNNLRPGQTIMVKSVAPSQAPRQRHPAPIRLPQNATRLPRAQGRHPAPLPDAMKQYQPPNWKALPPAPDLKLSKVENGIVISWKIEGYQEDSYEEIASYQLFAYQETSLPPSTNLWKKIGDVKALPLPMACTLTQFMAGYKYYFAVRAVDIRSRLGPFSLPGSILLLNKM